MEEVDALRECFSPEACAFRTDVSACLAGDLEDRRAAAVSAASTLALLRAFAAPPVLSASGGGASVGEAWTPVAECSGAGGSLAEDNAAMLETGATLGSRDGECGMEGGAEE